MVNRVVLIVLDSVGIGELPDAADYNDLGSNTLENIKVKNGLNIPNMTGLGLGNIDGVTKLDKIENPSGVYGKCNEVSKGKDTITGHWEISGVVLKTPLKTYPNGFDEEIIKEFEEKIGRKTIGNKVASGTEIIKEYGDEHIKTGFPIVYTSADSVFQIAADENTIPIEELYRICEIARATFVGENLVGRVIARPFVKENGEFRRTERRRDYALNPFEKTMLEYISENNKDVVAVGKIEDIFNKKGVTKAIHTKNNKDGIEVTLDCIKEENSGLIFTNLVDFDMNYGHRNNPKGYAEALEYFDSRLNEITSALKEDDVLIITADHGCDPTTSSTDHSREYIPLLIYGDKIVENHNLGIRNSFCDIGKTILELLNINNSLNGESFTNEILNK
ncbi:MAG: phosphopentomutase [Clostridiaceae bacterium]